MLVREAPQPLRAPDATEALIREARRRQRRRWVLIAVLVLALSGGVVAVVARDGGSPTSPESPRPVPPTIAPPERPGPPLEGLTYPGKLAVANDGSLLIADAGTYQIKQRQRNGALRVIAGIGTLGNSGDSGPATSAQIGGVADIAVARDGSIYFTDVVSYVEQSRLRVIRPDGRISTVSTVTGGRGLTIAPDGSIWIAALNGIYRVTPDGADELVMPVGPFSLHLPGGDAYFMPRDLAFDGKGNLYVSNDSTPLLVEFSPELEVLATWKGARTYGGIVATTSGVLFDMYGNVVNEVANGALTRRVDLSKLAGIPPVRTSGLARGPRGELYVDQSGVPGNGWSTVPRLLVIEPDGRVRQLGTHPA